MKEEKSLVPFESTPLRGERMLVLAPHPDDEVFGCGGLIAQHRREKRDVHVVVVTDGAEADATVQDREAYRARREAESRAGLEELGGGTIEFLRLPDRGLAGARDLPQTLATILRNRRPDLVLVPHPLEIHPDHVALARAFVDAIQANDDLREALATTKIAFYEISQPLLPNTLVDVSDTADAKRRAGEKHASQTAVRNYLHVAEGLNHFRTLTLEGATHAEGYFVVDVERLRLASWSSLCVDVSAARQRLPLTTTGILPIGVVIRTRNRIELLAEAVESVLANDYPATIVVVNDGGESPRDRLHALSPDIELVEHSRSEGRSEAMNAGVRRAQTPWIAFLDDDDLYYPDHLPTLANATRASSAKGAYTDAVSVAYRLADDGGRKEVYRLRQYSQDFDPDLLLVDNYIPLPTLLVRREDYLAVGGFDRRFDLFEDWDFLIRLTADGALLRVPRVTCEIRHLPESGSAVQAAPSASIAFREAKIKVWQKHADRVTSDVFVRAIELQKAKIVEAGTRAAEAGGRARHLEVDVLRLSREKELLIDEVQREHRNFAEASTERGRLEHELLVDRDERARLAGELDRHIGLLRTSEEQLIAIREGNRQLEKMLTEHKDAVTSQTQTIQSLFREIERLNEVIARMESTRAWRVHLFAERIKGRG